MRSLSGPLALLLVAAFPLVVLGAVTSASQWGRWLVRGGGALGVLGLVLTTAATVNLVIPRTCQSTPFKEVNRPVLSLVDGDGDCYHDALAQLAAAGIAGVATSAAVASWSRRRGRAASWRAA